MVGVAWEGAEDEVVALRELRVGRLVLYMGR
jgi:hypothetical protein